MWKAFFLAVGICLCILGAECLVIERAYVKRRPVAQADSQTAPSLFQSRPVASTPGPREVVPPDWAPWSLMSAGAVVVLYSFTLPRRMGG